MTSRSRLHSIVSSIVSVHPHEISSLLHASSCFFFILSAYFVVLPLRDDGAISLGIINLPGLFIGSLVLTLVSAPVSTVIFSLPYISKEKALVLIHRFFSVTLVIFFILWYSSSAKSFSSDSKVSVPHPTFKEYLKVEGNHGSPAISDGWGNHGWFYISVRIGFFLWVALLNLITISSTWARVIDVLDNESGARLFGFIGAGATLGQLFGSLVAAAMTWMGPFLLLFAALLMELAAQSSKGINQGVPHDSKELSSLREGDLDQRVETDEQIRPALVGSSPKSSNSLGNPWLWVVLDGLRLIMSSSYLLSISLFLWLGAVVSSFFYFQKITVIAITVASPLGRRRLFAQINSFVAVFILAGQLTVTGRILTIAGVTVAICLAPFIAFLNMVAITIWPTWFVVAVSETLRKVVMYVVTRPGRELLFTVVSREEKYKAKVCIDVIVQRLGDATAAGMYKFLFGTLNQGTSTVSLYALPVCFVWVVTAFHLGRCQEHLVKLHIASTP